MLLFRSEGHVNRWCEQRGLDRGAVFTPEQLWRVANHGTGHASSEAGGGLRLRRRRRCSPERVSPIPSGISKGDVKLSHN